jgi:hypothetical protein
MKLKTLALAAMLGALTVASGWSQGLTEVGGPWTLAAAKFYESTPTTDSSGTYYFPSMIQQGSTAFMFTQGGQFTAAANPPVPPIYPGTHGTSPVDNWCDGDKIVLWTNPLTDAGVTSPFTQRHIISHCFKDPNIRYHWGPSGALLTAAGGPVYIFANRTGVDRTTNMATGLQSYYLYSGSFNAALDDIPTWTYKKLFDVATPTPKGFGCCTLAIDSVRASGATPDGYTHQFFRGFGGINTGTVEVRMDFSQKYCDDHTTSATEACVIIELKSAGAWRKINSGLLDFTPDIISSLSGFRPNNLFKRGSNLELWGTQVLGALSTPCPCIPPGNQNSADVRWYTVDTTNFTLTGPNVVSPNVPAVRCMPASPAANRLGADLLVVQGHTYLFSSQNDDAIDSSTGKCTSTPFIGMDVVSTRLQ